MGTAWVSANINAQASHADTRRSWVLKQYKVDDFMRFGELLGGTALFTMGRCILTQPNHPTALLS